MVVFSSDDTRLPCASDAKPYLRQEIGHLPTGSSHLLRLMARTLRDDRDDRVSPLEADVYLLSQSYILCNALVPSLLGRLREMEMMSL